MPKASIETVLKPTLLSDYSPFNFTIDAVTLDFDLQPTATIVRSTLTISRRTDARENGPLVLNGEDIALKSVSVNGVKLSRKAYRLTQTTLELPDLPGSASVEIITECNPSLNSTLMGLYVSGGRFCTQCEAEGFRRISYYPDRPDVLSVFTVRISADKAYPYLLANGNCTDKGELSGGRHYAVWHDPFPKPCYLFALVAGDFDTLEDSFTTMSGRHIALVIYVDKGAAARANYAMDALKRAMAWDESAFGREYDLDLFMIVAVRDFNFGAMENKGLNIFNSALLLADSQSATDLSYERIESVVAHEYFHNWTGNRITCRDWFQLCLKEGFTVFRDQEFSADERGAGTGRIKDVRDLRSFQFPEDGGPLAHPVRPESYVKIDNFYTATIYEKGAELIRMLKTILGAEAFRVGCDYYFKTLDGTAATIEQFLQCFETTSGQDLSGFMRWYQQAGTPVLSVKRGPLKHGREEIVFSQSNQFAKTSPVPIPIRWQVIGDDGPLGPPQLTILDTAETRVQYGPITAPHSLSILQDFSAPVILKTEAGTRDHLRLMAGDPNAFTRWEAGQTLARGLMVTISRAIESGTIPPVDRALEGYVNALGQTLADPDFDAGFKALTLSLPDDMSILQLRKHSDPLAVSLARHWLARAVSERLGPQLLHCYHDLQDGGQFSPDASSAGQRSLKNRALALLGTSGHAQAAPLALEQFNSANNMTDELSALVTLSKLGGRRVDHSMQSFFDKWKDHPLVLDIWFGLQASRATADGVEGVRRLTQHPSYERRNPNRVRSLIGGFARNNPSLFHHINGSGYGFFTDEVLDMDSRNPQVAARLAGAYEIWPKLDSARRSLIKAELARILAGNSSKNLAEIIQKISRAR